MEIKIAKTEEEILGCYPTMSQLRPKIKKEEFVERVKRQGEKSYQLVYMTDNGEVVTVAGFRFSETLAWGKLMYVDDLITDENKRSKHYGDKIIDWLMDLAKEKGCAQFHLDSGVQRFSAHRFYFRKRLTISCYHFDVEL